MQVLKRENFKKISQICQPHTEYLSLGEESSKNSISYTLYDVAAAYVDCATN